MFGEDTLLVQGGERPSVKQDGKNNLGGEYWDVVGLLVLPVVEERRL